MILRILILFISLNLTIPNTTSKAQVLISEKEINDEIVTKGPLTPIRLAFDPTNDNRFAVVDVSNGTIGLWSFKEKFKRERLIDAKSVSVAFSPDGKIIASSNVKGEIFFWDNEGKKIGEPLLGHEGSIQDLDFSPDGNFLASAGYDHTVRIWNLKNISKSKILRGHSSWVRSISFSPDNNLIASSSIDGNVMLWTIQGNLKAGPLKGHKKWVESVSFAPDSKSFASAGDDGFIRLWDLDGQLISAPLDGHRAWIVDFSPCGNLLASSGEDGSLILRDIKNLHNKRKYTKHLGSVQALAFSKNCNFIATGGYYDGTIRIWNIDGSQHLEPLRSHPSWLRPLDYNEKTKEVILGTNDGSFKLYKIYNESNHSNISFPAHLSWVEVARFIKSKNQIVTGGYDGMISLWSKQGSQISYHKKHVTKISSIGISEKRNMIVSGDTGGTLILIDLKGEIKFIIEKAHTQSIEYIIIANEKKQIISSGKDGKVKFWDFSGKQIDELFYENSFINNMFLSSDEEILLLSRYDGKLEIRDNNSLSILSIINTKQIQISSSSISTKNGFIITSGLDGTIKIWDQSGNKIGKSVYGHNGYASRIILLENEIDFLTTGYFDNKINHWSLKNHN
ncbi:MAG: hypothetical protein CBC47_04425 [Alphaproteobacteria bacterium TMED87]|nr:hypothetical protein [Rhodospirillaceae bacterium]OUV09812.1 MAG: hypothetical protein CBC47_04425 [Alphaproteobacteria bacterium TMED87]